MYRPISACAIRAGSSGSTHSVWWEDGHRLINPETENHGEKKKSKDMYDFDQFLLFKHCFNISLAADAYNIVEIKVKTIIRSLHTS